MREEAVKEEELSLSRERTMELVGQPLFVLGWQGSNGERGVSDAYIGCVFCG